jgi:anti-sigma factor RsiW
MTTNAMSCELFNDQLMAYLERETDDATSAAMERHAVTCAECGPLLADLRRLRIDAANLPEMQPARDLWSGIAERIEAPVVPIGVHQPAVARTISVRRYLRGAAIAAGLVLAAGVGYVARGTTTTTLIDSRSR